MLSSKKGDDDRTTEVLDRLLNTIRDTSEGAFASIAQNPIIRAVSIPLGGVGGLALLDKL